jgi:hypothetical protein
MNDNINLLDLSHQKISKEMKETLNSKNEWNDVIKSYIFLDQSIKYLGEMTNIIVDKSAKQRKL